MPQEVFLVVLHANGGNAVILDLGPTVRTPQRLRARNGTSQLGENPSLVERKENTSSIDFRNRRLQNRWIREGPRGIDELTNCCGDIRDTVVRCSRRWGPLPSKTQLLQVRNPIFRRVKFGE